MPRNSFDDKNWLVEIKNFLDLIDRSDAIIFDLISKRDVGALILSTLLEQTDFCKFLVHNLKFNITESFTSVLQHGSHDWRDDDDWATFEIEPVNEYCWKNHDIHFWGSGLMAAGFKGNIEYFKFLLKKFGTAIFNVQYYLTSILHAACFNNNYEIVKFLVEKCLVHVEKDKNYSESDENQSWCDI